MKKVLKGLAVGVFALALTFSTPLETNASTAPCGHSTADQKKKIIQEATCTSDCVYDLVCSKCNKTNWTSLHSREYAHSWIYYSSFRKICIKCGHAEDFYD